MNKKPNPIHTLPEMIKTNLFLYKQHLTNIKYNLSWNILGLLTLNMAFKFTSFKVNLTVTLHQIHCSVKKTYVIYNCICIGPIHM